VWARLSRWLADGHVFPAPVIGCNKGGVLVRVCCLIGFVPASQLADLPPSLGTAHLRSDLEGMVGDELTLRLIELDPSRNRIVCSERATGWEDGVIEARLDELEALTGREVSGKVRSICDFGVFVDLGGLDGLIHISELSWQRVHHPVDVVAVGEEVRVLVMQVDRRKRRVALSRRRLRRDPWTLVADRYDVGDVIDARITSVVPFGAFAMVDEGVEGLIHISELSADPLTDVRQVVMEGQHIRARVLRIDPHERRLGLSMRQVGVGVKAEVEVEVGVEMEAEPEAEGEA
jgi:small subunit ribosomal protein S1